MNCILRIVYIFRDTDTTVIKLACSRWQLLQLIKQLVKSNGVCHVDESKQNFKFRLMQCKILLLGTIYILTKSFLYGKYKLS